MVRRFQIEDMIAQDAAGIVFRALDKQTGELVAIRRFLPFGVNGGGLSDKEQAEYHIVVDRLTAIRHPAMRSVIGGGCDAVDGMPYLATEWVEGITVHTLIEQRRLTVTETIHTIVQALEVCEEISHVLEREAVWIEVDVRAIIIGAEDSGRALTFGISPLKWLGKHDGQNGLDPIVSLTEELMGWRGKTIHAHESGGLGGWLKWLHRAAKTSTLSEAKQHLLEVSDLKSSVPTKRIILPVTNTRNVKTIKRRSKIPFAMGAFAALSAMVLAGWCLIRWNNSEPIWPSDWKSLGFRTEKSEKISISSPRKKKKKTDGVLPEPVEAPPPRKAAKTPDQINQEAVQLTLEAQKADQDNAKDHETRMAKIALRNGVFTSADSELLLTMAGQEVTLDGVLEGIKYSTSRATCYLVFSKDPPTEQVRGAVTVKKATPDLSEKELAALIGKKITLQGKILIESFTKRPLIVIEQRSNIQEVK